MKLQVLFYIIFILLSVCGAIGQEQLYRGELASVTAVPPPIVTRISIESTKSAKPIGSPQTTTSSASPVDIGAIFNNVVATILATLLISLTVLTRKFWIQLIVHDQQSPLKSKRKREALAKYLQQEKVKVLEVLAPGSIDLQVKDIVEGRRLFISPPWKDLHGATSSKDLIEYITATVSTGQRILLLGEPGQGKTIILKQVFTIMVDHFLKNSKSPVPLYIPLREFRYSTEDTLDLLWVQIRNRFPLPFEDFTYLVRNNQITFLYDGFDEIKGELTQHSINDRASSSIFSYPSILSCRIHFYDLYLSMSAIQEFYSLKFELMPLMLSDAVKQYIAAFCKMKQEIGHQQITSSPEKIVEKIQENKGIRDLVKRPLLLVMVLDIFTDSKELSESEWNMAKLYQKYTGKWLRNEAAKPDSVLRWNEKTTLMQEVAWSTHRMRAANPYGLYQSATFTREELSRILERFPAFYQEHDIKYAQVIDDICFRSFLIAEEGLSYYFIHKSFQEYYVAKYICDAMRYKGSDLDYVTQAFQELIPTEVSAFLKDMLQEGVVTKHDQEQMVNTLITVYQKNDANDDRAAIVRQYTSYYLTVLGTKKAIQFLEQSYHSENNKLVQRGIMIGLALNCNIKGIIEQYINIVNTDTEASSINIGYHLVHYGDQALEEGYFDKGGINCDGTLQSILRHLKSENYKSYWVLDLLTLRTLLETRGIDLMIHANEEYLPFLQRFLSIDYKEQNKTFQQEKKRLQRVIMSYKKKLAQKGTKGFVDII